MVQSWEPPAWYMLRPDQKNTVGSGTPICYLLFAICYFPCSCYRIEVTLKEYLRSHLIDNGAAFFDVTAGSVQEALCLHCR